MCIGIPMQVTEVLAGHARCRSGTEDHLIDIGLVGTVAPGTWVMTFLGAAREVLSEAEALRSRSAVEALAALMRGENVDIDAAFPDLAGRTPQLPEHLRTPEAL